MAVPVILDTDIGLDVDDVWALVFLLKCPELDVKLITTNTGDTHYSARLVAKLLMIAKRTDIPIGIGIPLENAARTHKAWLADYSLQGYAGTVYEDGVGAIVNTINHSQQEIAVISIGPLSNIAAALMRDVGITKNSRFIGMHGSIRKGYLGAAKPMREYNVKTHVAACQKVFSTPWKLSITPLDTCGLVTLSGENFQALLKDQRPLTQAVLDNHFNWFEAVKDWPGFDKLNPSIASSTLFDTVAVYMAFSEQHLVMEALPIRVTDDGKTIVEQGAQTVRCATGWKDQSGFERLVTQRLLA